MGIFFIGGLICLIGQVILEIIIAAGLPIFFKEAVLWYGFFFHVRQCDAGKRLKGHCFQKMANEKTGILLSFLDGIFQEIVELASKVSEKLVKNFLSMQ